MKIFTDDELIAGLNDGLSVRQLATKYRVNLRTIARRKASLAKKGIGHGGNVDKFVPDGYKVKGTSTLTDAAGNTKLQWVKTDVDAERQLEMIRTAIVALCTDITPIAEVSAPTHTMRNLCNLYTVSDFHAGMLACAEESGSDYDLKIAESLFERWFISAFQQSPIADNAVISLLGDTLHYDSMLPVTPAHGHILDADSRYFRMIEVCMRMVRSCIDQALTKHRKVHVVISMGNHDETGALWLMTAINALYENEPRLTVDTSPDVFKMYTHGKTALFFHHGHKVRFNDIESVMISKFRQAFGESKYAYCHLGHLHHFKSIESRNMIVEQHRTLAAKDAYAAQGGWFSGRSANVITYHKLYGEVSRLTISPEMLR